MLINFINNRKEKFKMKFIYSTPSIYIEAINKMNISYSVKNDDFFPYAEA